jgi:hypothetical protein
MKNNYSCSHWIESIYNKTKGKILELQLISYKHAGAIFMFFDKFYTSNTFLTGNIPTPKIPSGVFLARRECASLWWKLALNTWAKKCF